MPKNEHGLMGKKKFSNGMIAEFHDDNTITLTGKLPIDVFDISLRASLFSKKEVIDYYVKLLPKDVKEKMLNASD